MVEIGADIADMADMVDIDGWYGRWRYGRYWWPIWSILRADIDDIDINFFLADTDIDTKILKHGFYSISIIVAFTFWSL